MQRCRVRGSGALGPGEENRWEELMPTASPQGCSFRASKSPQLPDSLGTHRKGSGYGLKGPGRTWKGPKWGVEEVPSPHTPETGSPTELGVEQGHWRN